MFGGYVRGVSDHKIQGTQLAYYDTQFLDSRRDSGDHSQLPKRAVGGFLRSHNGAEQDPGSRSSISG